MHVVDRRRSNEIAPRPRTSSPTPSGATDHRSSSSARTSTPCSRARASTTTAAAPRRSSRSPRQMAEARDQAAPTGALRVLGRRGVGPARLDVLRREPDGATRSSQLFANLNFDMLGSPNYVRFVYDGDGSEPDTPASGSAQIETLFDDYFASQGLADRADRVRRPLRLRPVPRRRRPRRRAVQRRRGRSRRRSRPPIYGGTAGEPYDSCYHQACDDITQPEHEGAVRARGRRGARRADAREDEDRVLRGRQQEGRPASRRCAQGAPKHDGAARKR